MGENNKFYKTGLYDGAGSESDWITVENGEHVLVEKGQTKAEAIDVHFEKAKESVSADSSEGNETSKEDISQLLGTEFQGYKGQQAIDKLMQEKQGHIKGAFYRDDIGDIDLLWGNDYCGLQHILKRREEQGIDTTEFLKDITEATEHGTFRKKNNKGNYEFFYKGKIVIIAPELHGTKITFLLTAFKTHSKK